MVKVFDHDEAARSMLAELLDEPSLYDEFLRYLVAARVCRAGRAARA